MKDGKKRREKKNGGKEENGEKNVCLKKKKKRRARKSLKNLQKILVDTRQERNVLEKNIAHENGCCSYQCRAKVRLKQLETEVIPRFENRIAKIKKLQNEQKNRINGIRKL